MAKECTLSTGKQPLAGLPRNSVVRITDRPNMTSAVYCGHKAINQIKTIFLDLQSDALSTYTVPDGHQFY